MVDDEPAVLEVLSEVIEDLGHEVIRARDGKEALALAREHLPGLIVTDHMMPRMSGLDLCREIRKDERLLSTPIILLSAVLSQGAPEAQAFLAKPFELADFEALVDRILSQQKYGEMTPAPKFSPPEPSSPEAEANVFLRRMGERLAKTAAALEGQAPEARDAALKELSALAMAVADAAKLAQGQLEVAPERGDFKTFLTDAVSAFRTRHPELDVTLTLPEGPVELDFDAPRIRQALEVLLENAARHGAPPPKVAVELELTPALAVVKVMDHGKGIPTNEQRGLFVRFGRPLGETAGLGTGLFIAAELTRLHGGVLAVRSAVKQGSTFSLGLPRSAGV